MSGVCMGVVGVFVRESLCSHRQPAILLTTEGQMPIAVCAPASPATVYLTYGRQPDDTLKSSINDIQEPPIALLSIYANLTYRRQNLLCFSRNFRQFLNIWKMSNWLPEHPRSQFCRWCWKVVQGCVGHPVHSADLLSPLC